MGVRNYDSLESINSSLPVRKFSRKLRRRAILKDIYAPGVGAAGEDIIFKRQEISIPNGIYTKISPEDTSGANNVRIALKMDMDGDILRGNTVALGREVRPEVKSGDIFRANYRFVAQDEPGYGENRLDAEWYQLYQEHVKDLAPHAEAELGLEIRQAFVETFGWNLWVKNTCTPRWSRHFYVAGINSIYNQPNFHPDLATYTNRIVNAMNTASGGNGLFAQTAAQMLNGKVMDDLARYAILRKLWPLYVDGKQAYILTISPLQAARFSNPRFTDTLGDRWASVSRFQNDTAQHWLGMLGKWVSAAGVTIYVVIDYRLPTLIPTGTSEPWGLRAGYVWPQQRDLRELENPLVRDASILHGSGGVVNWEPEKMHFIVQDWDYGVRLGKGYAGVRGVQQLQYDSTPVDPTGRGREYFGSCVVVLGRDETGTV
jgi:hypothetical protein